MSKFAIAAIGLGLIVPTAVKATAINIQFGDGNGTTAPVYTGTGAAASPTSGGTSSVIDTGTTWNDFQSATGGTATKASDGSTLASPITVTMTNQGTAYNVGSANTLLDYFVLATGSATRTFSLTGVANGTYDVYLYGVNGSSRDNRGTSFTITGVGTLADLNGNTVGDSGFANGVNYVVFPAVVVTGNSISGTYVVNPAATNTGEADFNGIQLVPTPEPASVALLALGSIGLLVRRRPAALR